MQGSNNVSAFTRGNSRRVSSSWYNFCSVGCGRDEGLMQPRKLIRNPDPRLTVG